MADAEVLVVSAGKYKEHADEMGLLVLHDVMPFAMELFYGLIRVCCFVPRLRP